MAVTAPKIQNVRAYEDEQYPLGRGLIAREKILNSSQHLQQHRKHNHELAFHRLRSHLLRDFRKLDCQGASATNFS